MVPPLETNSGGLAKDMTLRDWFAGQALAGLCAMDSRSLDGTLDDFEAVAKDAFDYADALLIERERGE